MLYRCGLKSSWQEPYLTNEEKPLEDCLVKLHCGTDSSKTLLHILQVNFHLGLAYDWQQDKASGSSQTNRQMPAVGE